MAGSRGDLPLVCVGIPVYNEETSLGTALESILTQDYERLEVIVCDNASTDSTVDVAKEFAANDARVKIRTSDQNRGASHNFNRAFRLSSCRYFTWASGHDTRLPAAIRACVEALEDDPGLVLCYPRALWRRLDGPTQLVKDDTLETRGMETSQRLRTTIEQLYNGNAVHGVIRSSSLARTRLFRSCFGSDHVLLSELSVLGGFHQLEEGLFIRAENRAPEEYDQWRERNLDMIGVDTPLARSRPVTAMGLELVAGVWHVSEPLAKVANASRASAWFRERWHGDLNAESGIWRAIDRLAVETQPIRMRVKQRVRRRRA